VAGADNLIGTVWGRGYMIRSIRRNLAIIMPVFASSPNLSPLNLAVKGERERSIRLRQLPHRKDVQVATVIVPTGRKHPGLITLARRFPAPPFWTWRAKAAIGVAGSAPPA